jgi:hypothetical protein
MKEPQPKDFLSQLPLPLSSPAPIALPNGKDQQLVQALIELLLSAMAEATETAGGKHESETDR